jgi:hypothetical protein
MASGWRTPLPRTSPTAQALPAEVAATLRRPLLPVGLGTADHGTLPGRRLV